MMSSDAPRSLPSGRDSVHTRDRRRLEGRRILAVGFGVSLVLHVLGILLYPVLLGPDPAEGPPAANRPEAMRPEGLEVVQVTEIPDDVPERPIEPDERPRLVAPVPEPPPEAASEGDRQAGPGDATEAPGEELGAADRVRATRADARLLAPLSEDVVGLSQEQIAQLELLWALEELNDSAAAMAAAARRATDWTYTDAEGRKWGFSPGQIHLGGITLPMPSFGSAYDPEAWKGSIEADLERAAGSSEARLTQEERAKAIRERRDRERRERADTTSGGG